MKIEEPLQLDLKKAIDFQLNQVNMTPNYHLKIYL